MLKYNGSVYKTEWKKIDALIQQGKTRSAMHLTDTLLLRAKADDNPAQTIKCQLLLYNFKLKLNENGEKVALRWLMEETDKAHFPTKPILQSAVAEKLTEYINRNYWKIKNRTQIPDQKSEDISTWSIAAILEKILELQQMVLETDSLQQIPLGEFGPVIDPGKRSDNLYPTLYDLLAHRAIQQLQNQRSYLTQPAVTFQLDQDALFASPEDFIQSNFETPDTRAIQYKIISYYKKITKYHQENNYPLALVYTDLRRLEYAFKHSVHPDKENLYEKALKNRISNYSDQSEISYAYFLLGNLYIKKSSNYDPLMEIADEEHPAKWHKKTAADYFEKGMGTFPETPGADRCKKEWYNINRKGFHIKTENILEPGKPSLMQIQYTNVDRLHIKIFKPTEKELDKISKFNSKDLTNYFHKLKPIHREELHLIDDGDKHEHTTEALLPALAAGSYIALVSANRKFSYDDNGINYIYFDVSDIAYAHRANENNFQEFYFMNRTTGKPLERLEASFYSYNYNRHSSKNQKTLIQQSVTKDDGYVIVKPKDQQGSFYGEFKYKGQTVKTSDYFSSFYSQPKQTSALVTHFFLDRAIYRPGQAIYFKGLLLEKNYEGIPKVISNKTLNISFHDSNEQLVKKIQVRSNEYGTFHGQFIAPESGLTGQMYLHADLSTDYHYFRVEEYKRPKFEVKLDTIKKAYRLEDNIKVTGKAKAFAGNAVDGAKVKYRVVREVSYPGWPWWLFRSRFVPPAQEAEIKNGNTITDENGNFEIEFPAIADKKIEKKLNPVFKYNVIVDVTDISGETQSTSSNINIGYKSMTLDLKVAPELKRNEQNILHINAKNLNGQFVNTEGTIKIERQKHPGKIFKARRWKTPDKPILSKIIFDKNFPNLPYGKENEPYFWPAETTAFQSNFNTKDNKKIVLNTKDWQSGPYKITASAKDKDGNLIETIQFFNLHHPKGAELAYPKTLWHFTDSTQRKPGQIYTAQLNTSDEELYVLVEKEERNKIKNSKWYRLQPQQKLEFPIEEKHRGNLHYIITYIKNNELSSQAHRITVPWDNKQLKIEYSTFRDKLSPGQKEEWQLKISGPDKDKVMAEMVAGLYDASLDQFVGHQWRIGFYPHFAAQRVLNGGRSFHIMNQLYLKQDWNKRYSFD